MRIISNKLESSTAMYKVIKLENDFYTFTISYFGEYIADKNAKQLDPSLITVICKTKKALSIYSAQITWCHDKFMYELPGINQYNEANLLELKESIDIAIKTKQELEAIFYEWFPKEAMKNL